MFRQAMFVRFSGGTFRRLALVVVTLALVVFAPRASLADDADQAADIAVKAFSAGGAIVGVNLGPAEEALLKGVVACGVRGKPVVECARDELVKLLPRDARPFVQCLLTGATVEVCGKRFVISKLPPEAQGLATCVGQRSDFLGCGRQFALDQSQQAAFETLNAIKADARDSLGQPGTGTLRNILGVAQGIREDNWEKVIQHGGTQIAKIAGKALLRVFLGPAAAPLDPAVDALIQNRVDLAVELFKAVKSRDENRIARVTIEIYVYLSLPLAQACALIPDGPVKEVTCGTIGKALTAFSSAGGDVVEWGVGTLKDVAGIFGIDTGEFVSACGRSSAFYAKRIAVCWAHLVQTKNIDKARYEALAGDVVFPCRGHYQQCHDLVFGSTRQRLNEICNPLRAKLDQDVDKLNSAMKTVAETYARGYPPMTFADTQPGEYCEARAGQQFIPDCIAALEKQFAVQGDGPRQSCRPGGQDLGLASPLTEICAAAAFPEDKNGKLKLALRATCTPPCPEGMRGTWPNCTCFEGQVRKGDRCVVPACEAGKVGTPPNCQCPEATRWNGRRCTPIACPSGMVGTQPNCRCPANTTWNGQRCAPMACPSGMVGTQPNCRCPGNTSWNGRRCAPITCPPGKVGTPPNCRCPAGTAARYGRCVPIRCPGGMIGRPPNCQRPTQPPPAACPLVRTCVQWGRGSPGSLAGPCIRYAMRRQCPANVR